MDCTVRIEDSLLKEARDVMGDVPLEEIVAAGLRELVRTHQLQEIAARIGTETLVDVTVDELLDQRAREKQRLVG
jgi:hypothetical protein